MTVWIIRLAAIVMGLLCVYLAQIGPVDSTSMYLGAAFFFAFAAFSMAKEQLPLTLLIAGLGLSALPVAALRTGAVATPHVATRRAVYIQSEQVLLANDPAQFWGWVGLYGFIALAFVLAAIYLYLRERRQKEDARVRKPGSVRRP